MPSAKRKPSGETGRFCAADVGELVIEAVNECVATGSGGFSLTMSDGRVFNCVVVVADTSPAMAVPQGALIQ